MHMSKTWVQQALQGAGLVTKRRKRGSHKRRRPRRPLPGMLLQIEGSKHRWLKDGSWHDLMVILDDATSKIYYAQLVEEESTRTVMAALREVIETRGLFCASYSDPGQAFLCNCKSWRQGGQARFDTGETSDERTRCADHSRLFGASTGAIGAEFRDMAGPLTAGTQPG